MKGGKKKRADFLHATMGGKKLGVIEFAFDFVSIVVGQKVRGNREGSLFILFQNCMPLSTAPQSLPHLNSLKKLP